MKLKIYRVPGSHPCEAVIRAAKIKGIDYKLVDLLPAMHHLRMSAEFGAGTVPAIKIYDGSGRPRKVQTTVKCLRAIEALVPEPPLYPAAAEQRERVLEAEAWGVGEFQDAVRRLIWVAMKNNPRAMFSFENELRTPTTLLRPFARPTIWTARRLNDATDVRAEADLAALPGQLDEIDAMVAEGTIGGAAPNAADLAVLSSLWLLRAAADLRQLIDSRPCGRKTRELFGEAPGEIPAGSLPAKWLTAVNSAAAA
jgi:glutathione S-transferase